MYFNVTATTIVLALDFLVKNEGVQPQTRMVYYTESASLYRTGYTVLRVKAFRSHMQQNSLI